MPRSAAPFDAVAFVKQHGVVLASARGPVPSIAEAVAGGPLRGSWWAHPKGHAIFAALCALDGRADVVCLRLVGGKVSYVHRRLWPALVRLARELGAARLAAITEEHTARGAHRTVTTPFPAWVPAAVRRAGERLGADTARAQLGAALDGPRAKARAVTRRGASRRRARTR